MTLMDGNGAGSRSGGGSHVPLLPHHAQPLRDGGLAGHPKTCRARAMRFVRMLAPLLLVSLLSSGITVSIVRSRQHVRATRLAQGGVGGATGLSVDLRRGGATAAGVDRQPWAAAAAAPPKVAAAAQPSRVGNGSLAGAAAHSAELLQVAIVNHAPFHLEIVAGLLHVLSTLPVEVTWYQVGQVAGPNDTYTPSQLAEVQGFQDLVGPRWLASVVDANLTSDLGGGARVDYAIFVSPEYFLNQTRDFVAHTRPWGALMLVHNGDNANVRRLAPLPTRVRFAALGPHVAATVRSVLKLPCEWLLATHGFTPHEPCTLGADTLGGAAPEGGACQHGFTIQGNFEPHRRNYTRVWDMLHSHVVSGQLPTQPPLRPFHLHLVGRGNVDLLQLPGDLAELTTVHFGLMYLDYYEQIHHTHGLLLVLGSPAYTRAKLSSTVVSSLVSGVPLIADAATLRAYTFLTKEHVFTMLPGEDEVDTMLRALALPPAEIHAKRSSVVALARNLNVRSSQMLRGLFPSVQVALKERQMRTAGPGGQGVAAGEASPGGKAAAKGAAAAPGGASAAKGAATQ